MGFEQFVEAIVQCICACTVSNLSRRLQLPSETPVDSPVLYCRVSEIREEAKQLLDLFGLLSLPSVLALTKRPLKKADNPEGDDEAAAGEPSTAADTFQHPRATVGLRLFKTPNAKDT